MHSLPVQVNYNLRKEKQVTLTKDLPTNHSFGNTTTLRAGTIGRIMSDGFSGGMLLVLFNTYGQGRHETRFNPLSAKEYLSCDPW